MSKTHLVLDVALDNSPVFAGSEQQCEEWKASQGFGYTIVPMTQEEYDIHNNVSISQSGKRYYNVPFELDVETWDKMSVVERLHYKGIIKNR